MKIITLTFAVAAFAAAFAAEETCKDGMCPLPASPEEAEFAVLSPVPETAVETVKQGPRLKSLDGKTIALVGGSFMASITHSELKSLILKEFPTAKVYLLNEIGSFASHTREELVANTRKVLWPAVKKALVDPITDAELASGEAPAAPNGVVLTGTYTEIQRAFLDSGWTDGLPVAPPTEDAVAEFLRFTDLAPDSEIGVIPLAQRAVTVRHVAVNGVMAGCPPEFMPVLIAFAEAMKAGDFRRTLVSTHAWTPYCWLNGPVARQLGFDSAQGEISEPKNAVLGRFMNLAMINLGGYRVKENRMGTFGYLMPFTLVENDAAAIEVGWKPYHMQQGYGLNDSTLSCASAINWGNNLVPASSDPEVIKNMIAWDAVEKQQMAVGSGMPRVYRTFLLTPDVARDLAKAYKSKDDLEAALVETARNPLGSRAYANYYGNPGSAFDPATCPLARQEAAIAEAEGARETATPPWLEWTGLKSMKTVPAMQDGKSIFLVTGDPARNKEQCVPGGGSATVKIVLPAKWDALMAEKGYEPLEKFTLKSDMRPDVPKPKVRGYDRPGVRADVGPGMRRPQGQGNGQGFGGQGTRRSRRSSRRGTGSRPRSRSFSNGTCPLNCRSEASNAGHYARRS